MGKVFLLLLAAAACVWFCMKDKKDNAVENKVPESKAAVQTSVQKSAAEKAKKLPPKEDSEFNPVPGSLAEQIVILSQKPEFDAISNSVSHNHHYKTLHTKVNKSSKCKEFLKTNETLLQECRKLSGFSTMGVVITGSPRQPLNYINYFRNIYKFLCYSAEYNINFGNKKQGMEDFAHAVKLLKTYCSGTASIIHFYTVQRYNSDVVNMVNRLRISQKNKDELLSQLLERKDFAASLSQALDGEMLFCLYLRKWHDVLPEILGIEPKAGKIPQYVQEIIDYAEILQGIPEDRLKYLCSGYNKILVKAFEENTVDKLVPFDLGTEKENKILATNHYGVFLQGIARVSKSIK